MKKPMLLYLICLLVIPMLAHEFWLQPEKFMYQPGEDINIRFWVGEDFDGSNWGGNHARVKRLQLYMPGMSDDLSGQVSDEKGDSLQLAIFDEGTAMVVFQSNNSFIQLEPAKFNAYLQEDGLTNASAYRLAHLENDSAGREFYQRTVKTLIQIGQHKTGVSQQTNLPVDIIPLSNPYSLKDNDSLAVRILFNRQPLAQQMINVWQRNKGTTFRQQYISNDKGEIVFPVLTSGKWMVSTVKMVHLEKNAGADWQSYWGSCTWGYQ